MAEGFVELGAEGLNHFTEKHFDHYYDKVADKKQKFANKNTSKPQYLSEDQTTAVSSASKRRHRNQLPSPERDADYYPTSSQRQESIVRDLSPERSETSERVLRAYEAERDDPKRKVESVLSPSERIRDSRMSQYNGYQPGGATGYATGQRGRSQPAQSKYDDDGDSDYDEQSGRRYPRAGGRGYRDDDDDYDREVIETERYKGPARPYDPRRGDSYGTRRDEGGPYGSGAVTQYRRSNNDLTEVSRRTRDRGRDDRYDDRDRSYSRSRSQSRDRDRDRDDGFKGKLEGFFDTSAQGLGVGLAGAVIGGLAGRQFGKEHKQRDIILGAIVGGLGANAAENKFKEFKDKKEDRYDGRARSSVR